jgi:hypothetical protein
MFDKKVTAIIISVIAAFNLLIYASMRSVLGFIGSFISFPPIIYLLFLILAAAVVLSFINLLYKQNKIQLIVLAVLDFIMLTLIVGYFIGNLDNYRVFLIEMAKLLVVYAVVAIIVYLIFYFHKSKYYTKTIATIICIVLVAGAIIGLTDIKKLQINYLTSGAAVYAVEDEYQIVWTTKNNSIGWVEIDGVKYYDEIAGSIKSTENVHKVIVSQSILDSAKSYTICSKTVINKEAYSMLKGRTFSKTYTFRPVDSSDGVKYYFVSDIHSRNKKAFAAATYYGADTDFVVIGGDALSYLDNRYDLERIVNLANGVSGGNIPVVYARGNHETKGEGAESLYKYVGATSDQNYYFTFRLGSVWGVAFDMGENHADEWKQHFGTANYKIYREAQLGMLDEIIADKDNTFDAEGITHKIAVSHIPTAFMSVDDMFLYDYLIELNQRLNQIDIDVMLSGHYHQIFHAPKGMVTGTELKLVPDYTGGKKEFADFRYLTTGAMYDSIVGARRSDIQALTKKEKIFGTRYTGTALYHSIDSTGDRVLEVRFTTDKKKVLNTINPFTGESLGSTIYLY